jgi:GntR family transcriptional regulator, transcriptional repressor for pyruvate dehydrogenase complex
VSGRTSQTGKTIQVGLDGSFVVANRPSRPFATAGLAEWIADDLQGKILNGELAAHQQLPSERHLATQYGLSRAALREAVRLLAERGLVEVQPGRGTYVVEQTLARSSSSISRTLRRVDPTIDEVLGVRRVLEIETVSLAALHRTDEHLAALNEAILQMDEGLRDAMLFITADHGFHRTLAIASGNSVFLLLIDAIADVLQASREFMYRVEGAPVRGQDDHRAIIAAVSAADVPAARAAMSKHLEEVARDTAVVANRIGGLGNRLVGR